MKQEDEVPYLAPRPAAELVDKAKRKMAELQETIREIAFNTGRTPDADAALDHMQCVVEACEHHWAAIRERIAAS